MATIDGGYAIIYANSTNETTTTNDSFTILGKVYANFISYNRTDEDRTILLYTVNNIANFTGIYCDLVSIGVGQVCIIATNFINFNSNNTANNITKKYIRINFLLSGSLLKVDELSNLPNLTVQSKGWLATSMSYGKHDFENEENEAEKKDISLSNDDSNSDIHTEMEIEHIIFIIFVIFDGESLIILDNIAEDYIGKILKDVSKTKKFILIKALVEIICKNIPLIVIM
ncbi:5131_t:CDS:2, partial [Gigaspora margarita]